MPARTGSRHAKRKRIAEEGMGPIIPHREDYNKLKPIEKSGVLYVGSVYREIFNAQVEGRYKFEVRANDNALGYAFCPQYVVPGGPKKYVHLRVGYSLDLPCGVFPLRGSRTMNCEPETKIDMPADVLGVWKKEAHKRKRNRGAREVKRQKWRHSGIVAPKYTVYMIDKPVWTGTLRQYNELQAAKQFPWAAEE